MKNIQDSGSIPLRSTRIVSAFPGTGKTYFCQHTRLLAVDSDSSKFDKSNFPTNYVEHIKGINGWFDVICVSSHKAVRDSLIREGLPIILVYPDISLKREYLIRYENRGSTKEFIDTINANWFKWIRDLYSINGCQHIVLQSKQYLSDVL